MDPRTTPSGRRASSRGRRAHARRRPLTAARHPGLFLSVAAAGAVLVNVVVGTGPAAQAEAASEPVSVADELGLTARSEAVDVTADLAPLQDLVASRSTREAAETAAAKTQAAADRAELKREKAEAKAEAKAKAKAKAKAEKAAVKKAAKAAAAKEAAAEKDEPAAASASTSTAVDAVARISNTSGPVAGVVQAAANAVVSNVSGAGSITLGGTRPSAADPGGHPSGRALDYMVMSNAGLGDAIVQYHIAHWDELGVDYLIWQQRYLGSPGGSWSGMADRGSATANHYDHVHVNYKG